MRDSAHNPVAAVYGVNCFRFGMFCHESNRANKIMEKYSNIVPDYAALRKIVRVVIDRPLDSVRLEHFEIV